MNKTAFLASAGPVTSAISHQHRHSHTIREETHTSSGPQSLHICPGPCSRMPRQAVQHNMLNCGHREISEPSWQLLCWKIPICWYSCLDLKRSVLNTLVYTDTNYSPDVFTMSMLRTSDALIMTSAYAALRCGELSTPANISLELGYMLEQSWLGMLIASTE